MVTNNKINVSPAIQRRLLTEVYIEKIDDVLAEYMNLFCKYPYMRQDQALSAYYTNLRALLRDIRFGTTECSLTEIGAYLQKAHAEKVKVEASA